jgi:protein arginine N-methyltransferase 1
VYNFVEGQFIFLNDSVRVGAYERAIAATVKPGDVVLDLGAGTGVMGLLACRAGAARVYSIEATGMVEIVRKIAQANSYADRIVCVHGNSTLVDLPERVDVLIADQTGPFGIGGGLFAAFNDAHRRFLKPHATTIPLRIELSVGLAEFPAGWAPVKFWDDRQLGFDVSAMRVAARNIGYEIHFTPDQLLSEPDRIMSVNLAAPTAPAVNGVATLTARRAGTLHGLFAFFAAELAAGVTISNSPLGPGLINRRAWFLPIDRAVALEAGDQAEITVQMMPGEELVMWRVAVAPRNGAAKELFTHSTFKGTLLAAEELRKMRPDFVPRLSAAGEAERTILELCDGRRSVRQIAEDLQRRFPGYFATHAAAAAEVTRVIARKSQ